MPSTVFKCHDGEVFNTLAEAEDHEDGLFAAWVDQNENLGGVADFLNSFSATVHVMNDDGKLVPERTAAEHYVKEFYAKRLKGGA